MSKEFFPAEDDLSEFKDYLDQFDYLMVFDNEDCPVCGVTIPEKITDQKSPFITYKTFNNTNEFVTLINYLNDHSIPYKIEKRINKDFIESIEYYYDVMIPIRAQFGLDRAKIF